MPQRCAPRCQVHLHTCAAVLLQELGSQRTHRFDSQQSFCPRRPWHAGFGLSRIHGAPSCAFRSSWHWYYSRESSAPPSRCACAATSIMARGESRGWASRAPAYSPWAAAAQPPTRHVHRCQAPSSCSPTPMQRACCRGTHPEDQGPWRGVTRVRRQPKLSTAGERQVLMQGGMQRHVHDPPPAPLAPGIAACSSPLQRTLNKPCPLVAIAWPAALATSCPSRAAMGEIGLSLCVNTYRMDSQKAICTAAGLPVPCLSHSRLSAYSTPAHRPQRPCVLRVHDQLCRRWRRTADGQDRGDICALLQGR